MSERQTKAGNQECCKNLQNLQNSHTLSLSHSLTLDMLNHFCFHVYAQKSHSHSHSHTISISHSLTLDMLNNFCFHLYAQKLLFIGENCNGFLVPCSRGLRKSSRRRCGCGDLWRQDVQPILEGLLCHFQNGMADFCSMFVSKVKTGHQASFKVFQGLKDCARFGQIKPNSVSN